MRQVARIVWKWKLKPRTFMSSYNSDIQDSVLYWYVLFCFVTSYFCSWLCVKWNPSSVQSEKLPNGGCIGFKTDRICSIVYETKSFDWVSMFVQIMTTICTWWLFCKFHTALWIKYHKHISNKEWFVWSSKNSLIIRSHKNTSLVAPGALAHRLQRRTACKIQNDRQGAPKWPTGSGKGSNPMLMGAPVNFC